MSLRLNKIKAKFSANSKAREKLLKINNLTIKSNENKYLGLIVDSKEGSQTSDTYELNYQKNFNRKNVSIYRNIMFTFTIFFMKPTIFNYCMEVRGNYFTSPPHPFSLLPKMCCKIKHFFFTNPDFDNLSLSMFVLHILQKGPVEKIQKPI